MSIRLELGGTIIKGKKYYTLINADLLGSDDLPDEYLEGYPHVYQDADGDLVTNEGLRTYYRAGREYAEADIDNLIETLRLARDRLHEINARLAKENEGWEGSKHTIII